MNKLYFADRMQHVRASEIRELLKITEQPEIISFAGGLPAPELFPMEEIAAISAKILRENGSKALQYSTTEGYLPLRQYIAARMQRMYGVPVHEDDILITSGSQQALDFVGKVFINEGDTIFCESPSYLGALNAFRVYGAKFQEVPSDEEGMIPERLEQILMDISDAKLVYINPDFQNPTGRTWSAPRRERLLEIANRYNLLIVEDNPYGELRFEGEAPPAVKSLDAMGKVIYLGTFSKTFCPGMRIGWIQAQRDIIEAFALVKQSADLHTSTISQMEIAGYVAEYDLDQHIEMLKTVYKKRRDTVLEAMKQEFPGTVKFNRPQGGLFTWVELPEEYNSRELLQKCLERNVAFVPGGSFYPCWPKENTFRINYSNMPEDRIGEGIRRIGEAMKELADSYC